MSSKRSHLAVIAFGFLLMAVAADGQMAPPRDTSALLANPRLTPEARQAIRERVDAVHAKFRAAHGGLGPEQFGVQCCQIAQIPAAAFTAIDGHPWQPFNTFPFSGYLFPSPSGGALWAPVQFPSGVEIVFLDFYYFDNDGLENIAAYLLAFSGGTPSSGAPDGATLASAPSPVGSSGYGYASAPLSYTVDNNVSFDPDAAQLAVLILASGVGSGLRFKAVDLWWMRHVSAPPATATFSDVPTNHPFFQFVEALAAAGITVGYPDGRFGVDDSITRGQMAVFLAKALGLYWPH